MDLSYKKPCMAFSVIAVLFVVLICSRDDLFQGKYLSSKNHLMAATNRRLLASAAGYDDDIGNGVGYGGGGGVGNGTVDYVGGGGVGNGSVDYVGGGDGVGDNNGYGNDNDDNSGDSDDGDGRMDRVGPGDLQCSQKDISISQGQNSPLPSGIPTYSVEIMNFCMPGSCSFSNVHLHCGEFGSARLINPAVFRRLDIDDCLVKNGDPISPGETIDFQYANTYAYPMSVSSATMEC